MNLTKTMLPRDTFLKIRRQNLIHLVIAVEVRALIQVNPTIKMINVDYKNSCVNPNGLSYSLGGPFSFVVAPNLN